MCGSATPQLRGHVTSHVRGWVFQFSVKGSMNVWCMCVTVPSCAIRRSALIFLTHEQMILVRGEKQGSVRLAWSKLLHRHSNTAPDYFPAAGCCGGYGSAFTSACGSGVHRVSTLELDRQPRCVQWEVGSSLINFPRKLGGGTERLSGVVDGTIGSK